MFQKTLFCLLRTTIEKVIEINKAYFNDITHVSKKKESSLNCDYNYLWFSFHSLKKMFYYFVLMLSLIISEIAVVISDNQKITSENYFTSVFPKYIK